MKKLFFIGLLFAVSNGYVETFCASAKEKESEQAKSDYLRAKTELDRCKAELRAASRDMHGSCVQVIKDSYDNSLFSSSRTPEERAYGERAMRLCGGGVFRYVAGYVSCLGASQARLNALSRIDGDGGDPRIDAIIRDSGDWPH